MLSGVTDTIEELIISMGFLAPVLACVLIIVESILPILPLCAFITINFISFGNIIGFLISWIFTCLGCFLSYYLVRKRFPIYTKHRLNTISLLDKSMNYIKNLSLPSLTVILAIPFTPAFMMNIAAGLSNMEFKKFFKAIVISKIFMVYFWGYVGVGVVESFKSPNIIIKVILMVLIAFVISKIVNEKVN